MIVIAGHLVIQPEASEQAQAALATVAVQSRAEDGNVDYRYGIDVSDPTRVNLFEQWESDDALNSHMGSAHMAEFIGSIGDVLGGPAVIVRYDVSGSTPLL